MLQREGGFQVFVPHANGRSGRSGRNQRERKRRQLRKLCHIACHEPPAPQLCFHRGVQDVSAGSKTNSVNNRNHSFTHRSGSFFGALHAIAAKTMDWIAAANALLVLALQPPFSSSCLLSFPPVDTGSAASWFNLNQTTEMGLVFSETRNPCKLTKNRVTRYLKLTSICDFYLTFE